MTAITRDVPARKICSACQEEKPAEAFRPNRRMRSGLDTYCRACAIAKSAAWKAANPDAVKRLERERVPRTTEERWAVGLWVHYRIRPDEYFRMLADQGGRCAVCGSDDPAKGRTFAVDHCHASGKVRGLLCHHCNLALGHFRDNVATLHAAIRYLGGDPA